MTYTKLNSHTRETLSLHGSPSSGFTITEESYSKVDTARLFTLTIKNTNAYSAWSEYTVCTLPWTSNNNVAIVTSRNGIAAVTTAGEVKYRPNAAFPANSSISFQGIIYS